MKVIAAFFASAVTALSVVVAAAIAFFPALGNTRWEVALHFGTFGSVIIFPLVLLAVLPYLLFRRLGWLNRLSVIVGGIALALAYPTWTWLINSAGFIQWWAFAVCGIAGALAAIVFCRIAGVGRGVAGGL